jgi:ABC-2 type transport system permease protein
MFNKFIIISKYTFMDIFKSKIFYVTIVVGLATMLMTYVATEFTYGVPSKVALDFGLGMLSISSLSISIFMGVTLLSKEIESRTLYMVISRPVPRWVFISGKISGLITVLVVNLLILSVMTILTTYFLGGKLSPIILIAICFNLIEAILLLLVVILFSLFSNTIISTVASLIILASGHAIKEAQGALFVESRPFLKMIVDFYHLVLPAFYKLNFKEFVVYSQTIDTTYVIQAFVYGSLYSLFLFFMIVYVFKLKNFD